MNWCTVPDQYAEFRAISDRLWQVPTGREGQHRFLMVVRQWWQTDAVVLVVDAANTFRRLDGRSGPHGDHACYIGCPPEEISRGLDDATAAYRRADWVARNGNKLSEREVQGFSVPTTGPDDIEVDYRP